MSGSTSTSIPARTTISSVHLDWLQTPEVAVARDYLLAGRTAEESGRNTSPATFPSLSKTARWTIVSFSKARIEFDGLPVFHLALTPIGDALESAKLGD